jgi:hypothetical protein
MTEGGSWAGNGGLRLEDNQQYGAFLTYQGGVSYLLASSRDALRGSLGGGSRSPPSSRPTPPGGWLGTRTCSRSAPWCGKRAWSSHSGAVDRPSPLPGSSSPLRISSSTPSSLRSPALQTISTWPRARIRGLEADARISAGVTWAIGGVHLPELPGAGRGVRRGGWGGLRGRGGPHQAPRAPGLRSCHLSLGWGFPVRKPSMGGMQARSGLQRVVHRSGGASGVSPPGACGRA